MSLCSQLKELVNGRWRGVLEKSLQEIKLLRSVFFISSSHPVKPHCALLAPFILTGTTQLPWLRSGTKLGPSSRVCRTSGDDQHSSSSIALKSLFSRAPKWWLWSAGSPPESAINCQYPVLHITFKNCAVLRRPVVNKSNQSGWYSDHWDVCMGIFLSCWSL